MRQFLTLSILLLVCPMLANSIVSGTVTESSQDAPLKGALVKIAELNRETSTDDQGCFEFKSVPAGEYKITAAYLGYQFEKIDISVIEGQPTEATIEVRNTVEEMVIYGQASSSASALNQQRAADYLSSVVSSDQFGQLPDANLSEALQRVPGVFLERDQGEGRFVGIRGIDPGLNGASINGANLPAPENNTRAVALDVIPSELLETLTVKKSFTPDMDPEGLGGSIDVKSFSAFDTKGQSFRLKSEVSNNQLEDTTSPKLSARYSNRFDFANGTDNLGVAFSASWADRSFGTDNMETDGGWFPNLETEDGDVFTGAEEIEKRNYQVTRERTGYALNVDLHNEDGSKYYVRTLASSYGDQEFRNRIEYKLDKGDAIAGTDSSATWDDANVERSLKDRFEVQDILSVTAGLERDLGEWELDFSVGVAHASEEEPGRIDTTFKAKGLQIGYAGIGPHPELFAEPAIDDPSAFELDEITVEDNLTEDKQNSIKFDVKREFSFDQSEASLQFGAKLRRREKDNDLTVAVYDGFPNDPLMSMFTGDPVSFDLGDFGLSLNPETIETYLRTTSGLELNSDDTLISSIAGDYEMSEDINAFYLMSKYKRGALRLVYGARFESTSFTATGQRIVIDGVSNSGDPTPVAFTASQSYRSLLPSINLKYSFSEALVLRAAYFESIARPSFGHLSPGGEAEFEAADGTNEFKAEIGNPALEALSAANFDLSLEYYDEGIGLLAAGVFHKSIDDFVVLAEISNSISLTPLVGNVRVDDAEVIAPINGQSATLTGVELTFTRKLSGLPSPWNGLLFSSNITLTDSEAHLSLRDEPISMPRQADRVYNIGLGYETHNLAMRLAVTSKSERLLALEDPEDATFDIYQDAHTQVDFSLKYFANDQWLLYLDGNNLTDEPYYAYFGEKHYNRQYERYGPSYALGLQYRL